MAPDRGFTWNSPRSLWLPIWLAAAMALALLNAFAVIRPHVAVPDVSVIVRELGGAGSGPERLVEALGGKVTRSLAIIDGFAALVPANAIDDLEADPRIHSVSRNGRVRLSASDPAGSEVDLGSMLSAVRAIGADDYWNQGWTGRGIDIALIDSGVAPVAGLDLAGKVIYGPDLSFESQSDALRHLDTYGHGTHMAGIIAGRDAGVTEVRAGGTDQFLGVAPDARIVSLKVADAQGWTDVSQVIAAIDWVVQHRQDPVAGLNIRVLNLSFGTDGTQSYLVDPLTFAAEVAWRSGIVVVVAAGNEGFGSEQLNNPAYDPFVIAVGAADHNGTVDVTDDTVATFSSKGDGFRNPDLLAPGRSIASLRVPGSFIDQTYAGGRVGARFFRGSGTSQAAAMVSGAAALIIQQRPTITPDQLKQLLTTSAYRLSRAHPAGQGKGLLDLSAARDATVGKQAQPWRPATGTGSLDLARGSAHLVMDGVVLAGERDIFGTRWDAGAWSAQALSGNTWRGGEWSGNTWSGNTWSGNTWSGNTWSGNTWSGNTWSGNTWSGNTWSGATWGDG